jgi:hypothetical protein
MAGENFPFIKAVRVSELIPYARNSRIHSDDQIGQISASIREFGFLSPIVIDSESGIIAGHGRVMAAKKLGMESVPCIEASHLTAAQRRAFVIADNKIALNSEWDDEMLRVEFQELGDLGFDVELTGFTIEEVGDLGFLDDSEVEMPDLADGEKEPFQQKTFTLHDEQAAVVDEAIGLAKSSPLSSTGLNDNSNGNALALICEQWLRGRSGKR